jgi:catechol 2,3-dioxygenase-like lactoylglutathione lyase family enzyme
MPMNYHLRIARPVRDLERTQSLYRDGLGLRVIGSFEDHDGFDGVMMGAPGLHYHFEFTRCAAHPVAASPTPEDLAVFYIPDRADRSKQPGQDRGQASQGQQSQGGQQQSQRDQNSASDDSLSDEDEQSSSGESGQSGSSQNPKR